MKAELMRLVTNYNGIQYVSVLIVPDAHLFNLNVQTFLGGIEKEFSCFRIRADRPMIVSGDYPFSGDFTVFYADSSFSEDTLNNFSSFLRGCIYMAQQYN